MNQVFSTENSRSPNRMRAADGQNDSCDLGLTQHLNPCARERLAVITESLQKSLERATRDMLRSGMLLIEAKALVGHGHFIHWLTDNFSLSVKTANRLMCVAQMVQRHQVSEEGIAKLLSFDTCTLYELAAKSTPESVQRLVLSELKNGKFSRKQLREWKQLERRGELAAARSAQVSHLVEKIQDFQTWLSCNRPLLEDASSSLDDAGRESFYLQVRQLKASSARLEAILLQAEQLNLPRRADGKR